MPSLKTPRRKTPSPPEPILPPAAPPRLFAGTSGWAYNTWKPGFYPKTFSSKKFLRFYSSQLNSCEVNYTFRKLPTKTQLEGWLADVPDGFRFSFKAPQRITHYSRLRDCRQHVCDFLDAIRPAAKANKLGLVLFQLPPNFKANLPLLREFLSIRRLRVASCPPIAFEFRHDSWFTEETGNVLRRYNAAFCISETDDLLTPEVHSAVGHSSFRLRRGGGYQPAEVEAFVERVLPLTADRDIYVYFKHEDEPTGALNAAAFLKAASARKGFRRMSQLSLPRFQALPFHPRQWLANGHLQTIFGNYLHRPDYLPPFTSELVEVSPATHNQISSQVLCHCHWQPDQVRAERLTVILLHGLEGSSKSQYVVGNANKMWRAGFNIVRMNMRNCGGTESLSPTLYHSGMSGDVAAVMATFLTRYGLSRVALVGYSMGGNIVLKLAGELGQRAPASLSAVVGVSPALDLGPSADALHEPFNRVYEHHFLSALTRHFRRKALLFPHVYDVSRSDGLRSLRDFDDRITALYGGFASASDYYSRAAAARVLADIAIPTLILHALDDPFVRITRASCDIIAANPGITLVETKHGGHCAFLGRPESANEDGYWAESTLLRFLAAHA